MTQAPDVPQYMRRVVLDPIPELSAIRDAVGVQKIVTPLGLPAYLVTRYGDVKAALADPARFSNRKPLGWGADSTAVTTEEHTQLSAGNLLGIDPPEHQRLRRMLTPEFTIRRMKRGASAAHPCPMQAGPPNPALLFKDSWQEEWPRFLTGSNTIVLHLAA